MTSASAPLTGVPGVPVLEGIVGSQAYGLATPDSDEDRLGVYIAPTEHIVSLRPPADTVVHNDPDITYHEVGKFLRLCLSANPTVLELLFLDSYTIGGPGSYRRGWGQTLLDNREAFLSNRVRKTYGGYAKAQMEKLQRRGDFGSDLKKRYAKHARHCMRLLHQGNELLTTGVLHVRLIDPAYYHWLGELPPDKLVYQFDIADRMFQTAESVLPDEPDTAKINDLLVSIRRDFFSAEPRT